MLSKVGIGFNKVSQKVNNINCEALCCLASVELVFAALKLLTTDCSRTVQESVLIGILFIRCGALLSF